MSLQFFRNHRFVMRSGLYVGALALLAACGTSGVNTGSGQAYNSAFESRGYVAQTELDEAIKNQKAIEPLLQFPARFGIARIENGRVTPIPEAEQKVWSARFQEYGTEAYGTIEPVNLTIATIAVQEANNKNFATDPIAKIRLGAAAQQLDAVFIYDVASKSEISANVLSVADLTIVGAYITPSRRVAAVGSVDAVLIDVRNGYPYITSSQSIDKKGVSAFVGENAAAKRLRVKAIEEAVEKLSTDVVPLVQDLKAQLDSQS